MKKVVLSAICLFSLALNSKAKEITIDIPLPTFIFGHNAVINGKYYNCIESGICKIKWEYNSSPHIEEMSLGLGRGYFFKNSNGLEMVIKGGSLSNETKSEYLSSGYFIVSGDTKFLKEDLSKFNIDSEDLVIPKGNYKYTIDKDGDFIIQLKLK